MEIKYICPFWGQDKTTASTFIENALSAGFDGVEVNVPDDNAFEDDLLKTINETGCVLIAQQWLPPKDESVAEYMIRFRERMERLITFNPVFINSHTGKDFFSFSDNCKIIKQANRISKISGVKIVHETHRGRFNFSTFATQVYLDKFPNMQINADISHWCNVSESFLEDQQETLELAFKHSYYIHARVGHTQSAQVNDPFAPEWKETLDIFVGWWKRILINANARGDKEFYICPEFGPYPYMPYFTNPFEPMQDQWDLNVKMMNYLKKELIEFDK